jgi:uncharacterized membrane protein YozB (DUF420 family)
MLQANFQVTDLPAVNATLNSLATVLLIAAWVLVKQRRLVGHRNLMIAALVCSVLFLASYLVYHAQVGSVRFQGTGPVRTVYFTILLTHTVLAALVPFLVGITVWRAYKKRWDRHVRIARWTLPIWLYVSVTGVVVYWMLYQMTW